VSWDWGEISQPVGEGIPCSAELGGGGTRRSACRQQRPEELSPFPSGAPLQAGFLLQFQSKCTRYRQGVAVCPSRTSFPGVSLGKDIVGQLTDRTALRCAALPAELMLGNGKYRTRLRDRIPLFFFSPLRSLRGSWRTYGSAFSCWEC